MKRRIKSNPKKPANGRNIARHYKRIRDKRKIKKFASRHRGEKTMKTKEQELEDEIEKIKEKYQGKWNKENERYTNKEYLHIPILKAELKGRKEVLTEKGLIKIEKVLEMINMHKKDNKPYHYCLMDLENKLMKLKENQNDNRRYK